MSDQDVLGLLTGIGMAVVAVAYLAKVYLQPQHFQWLDWREGRSGKGH